jgi:hypothetical protein
VLIGSRAGVGFGFWGGLAALAVGFQVLAGRRGWPGLGAVLRRLTRRWPVRVALLAGWLYGGWHVFVH